MIRGLAALWLSFTRRHFCFPCDRLTFRKHRHSEMRLAAMLGEEWQR